MAKLDVEQLCSRYSRVLSSATRWMASISSELVSGGKISEGRVVPPNHQSDPDPTYIEETETISSLLKSNITVGGRRVGVL